MVEAPERTEIDSPVIDPQVGDWVWVLFWRPFQVGNADRGSWNTAQVRVVSAERLVCCDRAGTALPPTNGEEGGDPTSSLYFALPENVFATREGADANARTRKTPQVPDSGAGMTWPG